MGPPGRVTKGPKRLKRGTGGPDTRGVAGKRGIRHGVYGVAGTGGLLVAALLVLTTVFGGTGASGAASGPTHVDVRMKDFALRLSRKSAPAGRVVFRVHNSGPSTHEINIDRTDDPPRHLPLKDDGLTVEEDAPTLHRIDSIEQLNLGDTDNLEVSLTPGRYVLWCNLEGHYLGGMHVAFDVKG